MAVTCRIKGVDSRGKEHWLVLARNSWYWNEESNASTVYLTRGEELVHEINVRNLYLDSEDRMVPVLVKDR